MGGPTDWPTDWGQTGMGGVSIIPYIIPYTSSFELMRCYIR